MKSKNNTYLLPAVLSLALGLRLVGIAHGFPFIFHPDEPAVIRTALELRFFPNPGHFDWPHLYMYVNYILYMIFAKFRTLLEFLDWKSYVVKFFPLIWNDDLIYYYLTRGLSAILGALTVIPLYIAGRDTFGKRVGIIAALTLAVLPFHVWHSHYALIDVPMLFFLSWGVIFTLNIIKRSDVNDYAGAGFYMGLAASTKYNAALNLIAIPLAHLFRSIKSKEKLINRNSVFNMCAAVLTSVVGFLVGTPYSILDFNTFIRTDGPKGALWQFTNVGSVPFLRRLPEFYHEMVYKVADDVGYSVLIVFFVVFAYLIAKLILKKKNDEDTMLWFITVMGFLLLLYVSGTKNSRSHYYFIAYPYLVLVFAYFTDKLMMLFDKKYPAISFAIFIVLFAMPIQMSLKNTFSFYNSDTRVYLQKWLKQHLTPYDTLTYNKANLEPVLNSFANKKLRWNNANQQIAQGYMIVENDSICDCSDFPASHYGIRLKKVANVLHSYRLGPSIVVYSVDK